THGAKSIDESAGGADAQAGQPGGGDDPNGRRVTARSLRTEMVQQLRTADRRQGIYGPDGEIDAADDDDRVAPTAMMAKKEVALAKLSRLSGFRKIFTVREAAVVLSYKVVDPLCHVRTAPST